MVDMYCPKKVSGISQKRNAIPPVSAKLMVR